MVFCPKNVFFSVARNHHRVLFTRFNIHMGISPTHTIHGTNGIFTDPWMVDSWDERYIYLHLPYKSTIHGSVNIPFVQCIIHIVVQRNQRKSHHSGSVDVLEVWTTPPRKWYIYLHLPNVGKFTILGSHGFHEIIYLYNCICFCGCKCSNAWRKCLFQKHDKQIWGKGYKSRWWFQTFFIFIPIWGNDPNWLIFFRWVETTN